MKLPIPSDWNSDQWTCYQIRWPDSRAYRGLLLGLLSLMTRGRVWDERTGSIHDIQDIAWEIFRANYPLVPCVDCPDNGEGTNGGGASGGLGGLFGEIDMPCIDLSSLIKIEGGILYVRDACCEWVQIGSLQAQVELTESGTYAPLLPEGADYTSCGRAAAITDAIFAVTDAMWDARNSFPWQWVSLVENAAPVKDLHNSWLISGVMQAIELDLLYGEEDLFDESSLARIKCVLADGLAGTDAALTDDEWGTIKSAYSNQFGLVIGNLYGYAIAAIGRNNMSNIGSAGAATQDENCDCPELNPEGLFGNLVWARAYSSMPRCNGTYTFLGRSNNGLTVEHQFVSVAEGFPALGMTWPFDITLGTTITELVIAHEPIQPTDELLHTEWNPAGGCSGVDTEMTVGDITPNGTRVKQAANGVLYQRSVFSPGVTAITLSNAEMRVCPQPPVTARTYRWKNHIVSVNNVNTGIFPNITW